MGTATGIETPGAARSTNGEPLEKYAGRPDWSIAPAVRTWGRLAGYSSGLPFVRLLPAAATTSDPERTVTATIASSSEFLTGEPRLRLITPGPLWIAASSPAIPAPTVMPPPNGLASQAWSEACG